MCLAPRSNHPRSEGRRQPGAGTRPRPRGELRLELISISANADVDVEIAQMSLEINSVVSHCERKAIPQNTSGKRGDDVGRAADKESKSDSPFSCFEYFAQHQVEDKTRGGPLHGTS
jgi:hypothetical protein